MKTVYVNSIQHLCKSDRIDKKMQDCYTNTGNLVWHECCKKEIAYDSEVDLCNLPKDMKDSVLVVASDNCLSPYESIFSKRLRNLLRTKAQIVVIGLGSQADKRLNTPRKLMREMPKSKIRLFAEIADKSVSIGVRGEFTAECLECMGIHNYRVIGCPSFYSGALSNNKTISSPKLRKTAINITGGRKNDHKILELVLKYGIDSRLIMQGKWDMSEVSYEGKEMSSVMIKRGLPGISVQNNLLESYWKNNAKIFFDLIEWKKYIEEEKFSFSFGTRLHGNMLQFLMGVPALWITHDNRTQEIVDILRLPHISDKELVKIKYLEELVEKCIYDKAFYKNFYKMRKRYIDFLNENGVKHNFYELNN